MGEGGDAYVVYEADDEGCLLLGYLGPSFPDGHFKTHNRFYVPRDTRAISFDYWVTETTQYQEKLIIYLGPVGAENIIGEELSLDAFTGGWMHETFDIPEVKRGTVQTLTFMVAGSVPATAKVNIDNIAFHLGDVTPGIPDINVAIEDDLDWVYQNTPVALASGGHKVALTVTVNDLNGNNSVSITVQKKAGSGPGEVTIEDTGDPLFKEIVGSMRSDGIAGSGALILEVTATGDVAGQAVVEVPFTCRQLGDIDGNGAPEPGDVQLLINKLNGIPTPGHHDRAFDLDVNGAPEPGDVSLLINILNGLPVP